MSDNRDALKSARQDVSKTLEGFAKLIMEDAGSRVFVPDDLDNMTVTILGSGMVRLYKHNGYCYVYDDGQGVCRPCTPEEDQGEWIPTP